MNKFIVTIGREFGSRGCEIGKKLSERFGIPLYNKNTLDNIAMKSLYLSARDLEHLEDLAKEGLPVRLWPAGDRDLIKNIYACEEELITRLADEKNSCIFVGRCADYILRPRTDCLNIFIYAPYGVRLNHLINKYGLTQDATATLMNRMDQSRHNYYKFFTKENRGDRQHRQLFLDSSLLGVDGSSDLIASVLERKYSAASCSAEIS